MAIRSTCSRDGRTDRAAPGVRQPAAMKKPKAAMAEKPKEPDAKEPPMSKEERSALAGDVFDALKAGDRDAFGAALDGYVKACSASAGEPDGDEGMDDSAA